ncbi:unnamed protein product [Sphagnum tenellum]
MQGLEHHCRVPALPGIGLLHGLFLGLSFRSHCLSFAAARRVFQGQADITRLLQMAATYAGKSFFTLRFSWLKICMETGFGWLLGLKEAVAVWVKVCNLKTRPQRKSPPQLVHKIKMASCHMSMDEVAKTYKITPVRRI